MSLFKRGNIFRQIMAGRTNVSDIDLVSWGSHSCDPSLVDLELRIQKKRHFELPSTMPTQVPIVENLSRKSAVHFVDSPVLSTA